MNQAEHTAEILVRSGYAHKSQCWDDDNTGRECQIYKKVKNKHKMFMMQPFAEPFEGYKQANAMEYFLSTTTMDLYCDYWYNACERYPEYPSYENSSVRDLQTTRLSWCLKALEESGDWK